MRFLAGAALCGLLLPTFLTASVDAAPIVYAVKDYPAYQNGWTLSGTITTDGTIGEIKPANLVSWSFTFTKGATVDAVSSVEPNATVFQDVSATMPYDFMASATSITQLSNSLVFFSAQTAPPPASGDTAVMTSLIWDMTGTGSPRYNANTDYYDNLGMMQATYLWASNAATADTPNVAGAVIATVVPEPTVLGALSACASSLLIRRRRRA